MAQLHAHLIAPDRQRYYSLHAADSLTSASAFTNNNVYAYLGIE
jgi:hypothetical protein